MWKGHLSCAGAAGSRRQGGQSQRLRTQRPSFPPRTVCACWTRRRMGKLRKNLPLHHPLSCAGLLPFQGCLQNFAGRAPGDHRLHGSRRPARSDGCPAGAPWYRTPDRCGIDGTLSGLLRTGLTAILKSQKTGVPAKVAIPRPSIARLFCCLFYYLPPENRSSR